MPRRNVVQEVLEEPCIYGGLLATRIEVVRDLEEQLPGHHFLTIDRLAFMPRAATPEQVADLTACGMTLANVRAAERAGYDSKGRSLERQAFMDGLHKHIKEQVNGKGALLRTHESGA